VASEATRSSRERGRSSQRLHEDMTRDTATEGDLHPVDLHKERTTECAAAGKVDGVAGMDAEMVQPLLQAMPCPNVEDTRFAPRVELIERHDSI